MNMSHRDFYEMVFKDFLLKRKGWNDQMLFHASLTRKSTFIIASSMGAKPEQLEKAWPDPSKPGSIKKMVNYKGVQMTEQQMKTLINLKAKKKAAKNNG